MVNFDSISSILNVLCCAVHAVLLELFCVVLCSLWFHSIPLYSIPFHCIPFHSILFYSIPFHSIPFHSILFCSVLFCSILFYSICFDVPWYLCIISPLSLWVNWLISWRTTSKQLQRCVCQSCKPVSRACIPTGTAVHHTYSISILEHFTY